MEIAESISREQMYTEMHLKVLLPKSESAQTTLGSFGGVDGSGCDVCMAGSCRMAGGPSFEWHGVRKREARIL